VFGCLKERKENKKKPFAFGLGGRLLVFLVLFLGFFLFFCGVWTN
jgi:hypothetical protein